MKWINFSDRLPLNFNKAIVRWEDTKEILDYSGFEYKPNRTIDIWSGYGHGVSGGNYKLSELEWLDESVKDGMMVCEIPVGSYVMTPDKIGYIQSEVDTLLAEQHRNTRHDAIDIVNDLYNQAMAEAQNGGFGVPVVAALQFFISKASKEIHNLPQRKP